MYWVADMSWTWDDLFLCCILESGAVCMLTRLGQPLLLCTEGNSLEMGPAYYLPLHPKQYITYVSFGRTKKKNCMYCLYCKSKFKGFLFSTQVKQYLFRTLYIGMGQYGILGILS